MANGHNFLDARGCHVSSSDKALMRQSPSGPWLWLIRVLVTTPQFPPPPRFRGATVVRVHVAFLILSLSLCKSLALPGYSSPKTRDLRKLKTTAFGRSPRTFTHPGAGALSQACSAPDHHAMWPTGPQTLSGLSVGPQAGLSQGQRPLLLHCLVQSCDSKYILSERNQQGRALIFLLGQLVCPALPKEVLSACLAFCCPLPAWIPLQHLQISLAS